MYMWYVCVHVRLSNLSVNYLCEMNKSLSVEILLVIIPLPTDNNGE